MTSFLHNFFSQTLYVGEHEHGLYAMPSLVDEQTLTISPTTNGPLLLEGPQNFQVPTEINLVRYLQNFFQVPTEINLVRYLQNFFQVVFIKRAFITKKVFFQSVLHYKSHPY